jgi:hypothetical protein
VIPWLLKVALAVGLALGLAVELGRPVAARFELHDVATDAANLAEEDLADGGPRASRAEARRVAESRDARLTAFQVQSGGRVRVRVARHVEPVVLDELENVEDWYEVEIAATSNGVPGT